MINGARNYNFCFWGDSLTAGTGASAASGYFPQQVADSFSRGRWHYNGGVGGETSTQIKTRLLAANADYLAATTIIWAGRNNFTAPTTVKADIAAMIAALAHTRYLVLSVLNGSAVAERSGGADYLTITGLNADLLALYGTRYIDVRARVVAAGAPGGSNPDATRYGFDQPPSGLVNSSPHLNDAGYAICAAPVYAAIVANGW